MFVVAATHGSNSPVGAPRRVISGQKGSVVNFARLFVIKHICFPILGMDMNDTKRSA